MPIMRLYCVVATFVILCPGAWCQTTSTADLHSAPKYSCAPLLSKKDLKMFATAQPKLRAKYSQSFSDADIEQIQCESWEQYRKLHPGEQLDPERFIKFASENFGGLKVTSKPDGAAIQVDGKDWADSTNTQSSCTTGTRHVRLTKPGYQEELGDAIVEEGKWTVFHRDLKKK